MGWWGRLFLKFGVPFHIGIAFLSLSLSSCLIISAHIVEVFDTMLFIAVLEELS